MEIDSRSDGVTEKGDRRRALVKNRDRMDPLDQFSEQVLLFILEVIRGRQVKRNHGTARKATAEG